MQLHVVSDAICPWCYVGRRRLEKALSLLPDLQVKVTWRPFELNPDMPKEGVDRRTYRTRKFGSWEESQRLDANIRAVGAAEGLVFRHDLMQRTPNTIDAHRVIWLAERAGVQDAVVEALFAAYFTEGRDIGESAVLVEIAARAGMDAGVVKSAIDGGEGIDEVTRQLHEAHALGLQGVPSFVADGRVLLSGAQPAEVIAAQLRRSAAAAA
jgi:predicted DsbA family dithiol-disulfide isomerase